MMRGAADDASLGAAFCDTSLECLERKERLQARRKQVISQYNLGDSVMPHAARLRKVGGSVMLAIPKAMLDALELAPDASVGLSIEAGKLVVDPKRRRRYSLDELLAQCKRKAPRSQKDRDWQASPPVGRELI
jgi:antitoxin ChpS